MEHKRVAGEEEGTIDDLPAERAIESQKEDALGRDSFVSRLARVLISDTTEKATGVVVGLAGTWGSGKSSILNLVEEHIREKNFDAMVVRFNPWLVSGRNDLIKEFFGALLAEIEKTKGVKGRSKSLLKTIVDYGTRVSPVLDYIPHASSGKAVFKAAAAVLEKAESLTNLRAALLKELSDFPQPIVVLIDEVDRVESAEVKAVAQLVRSIADFPNISYLLAYDTDRVAEALGDGDKIRGRNYLEKIVQLQIPVPMVTGEEMIAVLRSELKRITDFSLPADFWSIKRYQEMENLIVVRQFSTLRDVKRLVSTYRAVYALVQGEADWIDVLGYTALLIRAPATAERVKRDPELVVDHPWSEVEQIRRARRKKEPDEWMKELIVSSEDTPPMRLLLQTLFPSLKGTQSVLLHVDPLSARHTLLTVLRLGIVRGAWSRDAVFALASQAPKVLAEEFRKLQAEDRLEGFLDRFDDLYGSFDALDHLKFWEGMAIYANREPPSWQRTYTGMMWRIREITEILLRWTQRRTDLASVARSVFSHLRASGEIELTAHLLHHHSFAHGLFGREHRSAYSSFLTLEETETTANECGIAWKEMHLRGELFPRLWDLSPVFVMHGAGHWDESCKQRLTADVSALDEAVDAFTLMVFGPAFSTDKGSIERFVDLPTYVRRCRARLQATKSAAPHETVDFALRRAVDALDPDSEFDQRK